MCRKRNVITLIFCNFVVIFKYINIIPNIKN
jgi:hypothetical protein